MTLREALAHIEMVEGCSLKAAWDQLGEAIGDHEVEVRWPHTLTRTGAYDDEDIGPSTDKRFWKSARVIPTGGGKILDDPACRAKDVRLKLIRAGELHYRPVFVRREAVERIWPTANGTAEPRLPTADQIGDAEELASHSAHRLFRSSTDEKIRQEARKVYADPANDRPNVNVADRLIRLKLPDVRSDRVMEILREPEFAKQRRKAGERRKPGKRPKS